MLSLSKRTKEKKRRRKIRKLDLLELPKPDVSTRTPSPEIRWWGVVLVRPQRTPGDRPGAGDKAWDCLILQHPHGEHGFPRTIRRPEETARQAAVRHMYEQTGLSQQQWAFTECVVRDITTAPGQATTVYFVAALNPEHQNTPLTPKQPQDASTVEWMPIKHALTIDTLNDRRKQVLQRTLRYLDLRNNSNTSSKPRTHI